MHTFIAALHPHIYTLQRVALPGDALQHAMHRPRFPVSASRHRPCDRGGSALRSRAVPLPRYACSKASLGEWHRYCRDSIGRRGVRRRVLVTTAAHSRRAVGERARHVALLPRERSSITVAVPMEHMAAVPQRRVSACRTRSRHSEGHHDVNADGAHDSTRLPFRKCTRACMHSMRKGHRCSTTTKPGGRAAWQQRCTAGGVPGSLPDGIAEGTSVLVST